MSKKFYIFDSDALKNFHKRIFFSIIVFLLVCSIAIFRIADVMLLDITTKEISIIKQTTERGKIYDRNGQLLSSSINTYSLAVVNPKEIKHKFLLSSKLSEILLIPNEHILKLLNQDNKFVWIKRNISPKEHQQVINLGQINLRTEKEIKRIYPYGPISSHIVGYVDIDNKGKAGVERGLNKKLIQGENIYLTLDINLQNAVRQELFNIIDKFSADSGIALIMNVKTGEIISMNSLPDFDPNNNNTYNENNLFNRVLQANYEMGSTFKPITVAMGIDKKIINPNMQFDVSRPIKGTIHDFHPYDGLLDIKNIIVKSSNIGAAKIAKKIGKNNQIDFFKKIGFYEKIDINIKEAATPLGNKNNWGEMETMTIGYGHGFAITPLHLASAYSAIINEGVKVNPTILLNDISKNKEIIIQKETSDYILKLLRAVVLETKYTGPRVKIEGYEIGGKTGTAELINHLGQYQKNANLTSFIGVLPISKPKYLVLTIIENPKKIKEENFNITGAAVNAPLVKNIILRMIEILNIPKSKNDEILNADISVGYKNKYVTF